MRILIDDQPVDGLTAKRERSLMLGRVQDEVKGTVLTPAGATETYVRQTKRWFTILAVLALVLMVAISIAGISYEPRDGAFIAVGVVILPSCSLVQAGSDSHMWLICATKASY